MAMLDMLIQLRKLCGHVRYTDAVRQRYDHVMSVGKAEQYCGHVIFADRQIQWYGHVRYADAAEKTVWPY